MVTSLQLVGPKLSEAELLNAGRLVEEAVHPSNRGRSYERLASAAEGRSADEILATIRARARKL
jgi:hypothetical protein